MSSIPKRVTSSLGSSAACRISPNGSPLKCKQDGPLLAFLSTYPIPDSILFPSPTFSRIGRFGTLKNRNPDEVPNSETSKLSKRSSTSNEHRYLPYELLRWALKETGYGFYRTDKDRHHRLPLEASQQRLHAAFLWRRSRELQASTLRDSNAQLIYIVAKYIWHVHPLLQSDVSFSVISKRQHDSPLDEAIREVFHDKALAFLAKRGYTPEDIATWAWILTSERSLTSVMRYSGLRDCGNHGPGASNSPMPSFVFNFILNRKHISAEALGALLKLFSRMFGDTSHPLSRDANGTNQEMTMRPPEDDTFMNLLRRLVRTARKVSPAALVSIAEIFTSVFSRTRLLGKSIHSQRRHHQRFTTLYNKCISLMAAPCSINPYDSIVFQHRAIFHLLREMAQFSPPLVVSRNGYRAIVRVQVARPKTFEESVWGEFKGPSWPPWKEEKMGIDAERGNEGAESMGIKALRHMVNAGYSMSRWDQVARIVAGWDIDGTPTIQTRTILPDPTHTRVRPSIPPPGTAAANKETAVTEITPDIWAARVRATRTLKEGWACYLAYKESGLPPNKDVSFEIIQKLVYAQSVRGSLNAPSAYAIPGDGKEVSPEPASPRDVIYVPSEPPHLDEFLEETFSQEIRLSGPTLYLLLTRARTFEAGMEYLSHSDLPENSVTALRTLTPVPHQWEGIKKVPEMIFTAYINFLLKFYNPQKQWDMSSWEEGFPVAYPAIIPQHGNIPSYSELVTPDRALLQAVFLTRTLKPWSARPWNLVLWNLMRHRVKFAPALIYRLHTIVAWKEVLEVLRWMKLNDVSLDLDGFHALCSGLLKANRAYGGSSTPLERDFRDLKEQADCSPVILSPGPDETISEMLSNSFKLLNYHFYRLVSPTKEEAVDPANPSSHSAPLLSVPESVHIHAFIRTLSSAGDYEGLLALLRWMQKSEGHLRPLVEERPRGGKRILRRAVVAFRAALEGSPGESSPPAAPIEDYELQNGGKNRASSTHPEEQPPKRPCPDHLVQEAKEIIQSTELLSPWPTDEEVLTYLEVGAEHKANPETTYQKHSRAFGQLGL